MSQKLQELVLVVQRCELQELVLTVPLCELQGLLVEQLEDPRAELLAELLS